MPIKTAPTHESRRLPDSENGLLVYPLTWQLIGAATLVMGAGALHFVYAPIHLAEARGQGLFFLMLGFAQVGWGATVLRLPSARSYLLGMTVMTIMPAVMYTVTRFIAAPFGDGPESVDLIGLSTLVGEGIGAALLAWHGLRQRVQWRRPNIGPTPLVAILVGAGLVAAGVAFGAGVGAAATVPWLAEGEAAGHSGSEGVQDSGGHHATSEPGPHATTVGPLTGRDSSG